MKRCLRCATDFESPEWTCPQCGWLPAISEDISVFAPELAEEGAGFDPSAFAELATLESGSFWFRSRNRLILWALRRYCPLMAQYLEIGCGTGFVLSAVSESFPEARLSGSDVYVSGLRHARARVVGVDLLQMDARRIPFSGEFDVIGAFDVLEHIEEDDVALAEMFRAIRPGGGIVVTVPQHPWLWSPQDDYACHVRRYRRDDLRAKVADAGFEVRLVTSFVTLLLPALAVSRALQRDMPASPRAMTDLQLPTAVDRALEGVMAAERLLVRAGVPLPFGGSLLLVGTRP